MNILLIRPGAFGDTLMLLPSLVNISGQLTITLVARQPGLYFIQDFVNRSVQWHPLGPAVQVVQKKWPGIGLFKEVLKAAIDLSHAAGVDGLNKFL